MPQVDFELLYQRFDEVIDDINFNKDEVLNNLLPVVQCVELLAQKYHVVCTNPPYMGNGGMSALLSEYVKSKYVDSRYDLYAVFIERCNNMVHKDDFVAMITQHSWMFISSYKNLRDSLQSRDIINMTHLGPRAFEEIGGEVVQTTSFVIRDTNLCHYKGIYFRLVEENSQKAKEDSFISGNGKYISSKDSYAKIPGAPIAYWCSPALLSCFKNRSPLDDFYYMREGIHTADNNRFLRLWFEIDRNKMVFNAQNYKDVDAQGRWIPYNKGGTYRKWYGNNEYVIGFDSTYRNQMAQIKGHIRPSQDLYFKDGATWSAVSMAGFSARYYPKGFLFDAGGQVAVGNNIQDCLAYLNSCLFNEIASLTMPTINYKCGVIKNLPNLCIHSEVVADFVKRNIELSRDDWDAYETSWDFKRNPLV